MPQIKLKALDYTFPGGSGAFGPYGQWSAAGGGTLGNNLGDLSNSTGIVNTAYSDLIGQWQFENPTLQSDTIIKRVQLFATGNIQNSIDGTFAPVIVSYDGTISNGEINGRVEEFDFPNSADHTVGIWDRTLNYNNENYSLTDVNNLRVRILSGRCPWIVNIKEVYLLVDYIQPPRLTTVGDNTTITDTVSPTYQYTFTSADNDYLGGYHARIFELSTTLEPGFSWFNTPALWDSGVVSMPNSMMLQLKIKPGIALGNGRKYIMYARAIPKSSSLAWSPVIANSRIIQVRMPVMPRLDLIKNETNKSVKIEINREDNQLSEDASILTTTIGGWNVNTGGASVSRSTAQTGYDGSFKSVLYSSYVGSSAYSFALGTSSTPYNNTGATAPLTAIPNEWHSFSFQAKAIVISSGTEFRFICGEIHWYTASNTLISTSTGNLFRTIGQIWTQVSVTAKAPANAAKCTVVVKLSGQTGTGEYHFYDQFDFHVGGVNALKNPNFLRNVDANAVPDDWTQYDSGNGSVGIASMEYEDYSKMFLANAAWKWEMQPSPASNAGIKQVNIQCAKSSVNTLTAWFIADYDAVVYVQADSWSTSQTTANLVAGVMTPVSLTGTMPSNLQFTTVYAGVRNNVQGGTVWIGAVQLEPKPVNNSVSIGTIPNTIGKPRFNQWTQGGFPETAIELEVSEDGGETWMSVWDQQEFELNEQTLDQQEKIVVYDYLEPLNKTIFYRARNVFYSVDPNDPNILLEKSSAWSQIYNLTFAAMLRGAILKSISDPSLNITLLNSNNQISKTVQKQRQKRRPLNSLKPIIISGISRSVAFSFAFYCRTRAEVEALEAMLDQDETMFLTLPKASYFVNLDSDYMEDEFISITSNDTDDTIISGSFQEVRRPKK